MAGKTVTLADVLTTLKDLVKETKAGKGTQEDFVADAKRLFNTLNRTQRSRANEQMGLSSSASATDFAMNALHGKSYTSDRQWEAARQAAKGTAAKLRAQQQIEQQNAEWNRGAAKRAFQAQQTDRFRTAGNLNALGLGGLGNPMAAMSSRAGAMSELGVPGASMLSRFAGPAGAVIAGVQAASKIHNVTSDPYATRSQMARSLAKQMPLGETVMGLADSFNARHHNMALVEHGLANLAAESSRDNAIQAHNLSYNPMQARREGMAGAFAGGSAVTAGIFDRGTVAGQTAADDARRLLPYRQATAKAEREMLATTAQRVAAEKELSNLQVRETQLLRDQVKIQKKLEEGGSGPERKTIVGIAAQNAQDLQRNNEMIRDAKRGVTSSRGEESQAKGEYEKAAMRESKLGEAEKLRDRAQRSESSAMRLGGMAPGQAEIGDALVDQIKQNPELIRFLPSDQLELARQIDPDAVDTAQKNLGANSAVFKKKQAEGKGAMLQHRSGSPGGASSRSG